MVNKVYDSCFQIENKSQDITITPGDPPPAEDYDLIGTLVMCELDNDIQCKEVKRRSEGNGFFTITLLVIAPMVIFGPEAREKKWKIAFMKNVTLCHPEKNTLDCSDSTLLNCSCIISQVKTEIVNEVPVITEITVSCSVTVCLVLKSTLLVQLLVPSYGFCIPEPCTTETGICPPLPPEQCF